jgi:hypothetical protein
MKFDVFLEIGSDKGSEFLILYVLKYSYLAIILENFENILPYCTVHKRIILD